MTPEQEKACDEYCELRCTSRCGNDIDCPHIEEFMEINNIEE